MSLRDDILDRINIVDLVTRYVDLKKVGKNWVWLCPFHREKSPSFTVAEDKQIFKCFWCGKWWNAITFHMEAERIEFWDSIQELAKESWVDIKQYQKDPEKSAQENTAREKFKVLNKRTQSWFQTHFEGSSAQEYSLNKRKLTPETIKTFGIGFAPDSHYDLTNYLKEKWFTADDMTKAWVAKLNSWGELYAFFRERLTFPIHNHMGAVVWFGARALHEDQTPKYLNTTETPLYNKSKILYWLDKAKQRLNEFGAMIIVEWYMDVIALHQYGLPVGIATCGTALTTEHAKLLRRHWDTLYFAFDWDKAWFEASIRWLKVCYQEELYPRIVQIPEGYKDIDEYLTNSWEQVTMDTIRSMSTDWLPYILQELVKKFDPSNPVERKKIQVVMFDLLNSIEDYSILMMYLEQMAQAFNTTQEVLLKQYKTFLWSKKRRAPYQAKKEEEETPGYDQEEMRIGALLYNWFMDTSPMMKHPTAEILKEDVGILKQLSEFSLESVISQMLMLQPVPDTVKEHLLEMQLRREKQRGEESLDKQVMTTHRLVKSYLHKAVRQLLKSSSLSTEQKQALMRIRV